MQERQFRQPNFEDRFASLSQGSGARLAQIETAGGIVDEEVLVIDDFQTTSLSRLKESLSKILKPVNGRVAVPAAVVLITIAAACADGDSESNPTPTHTFEPTATVESEATKTIERGSPIAGEITAEEMASMILTPDEVQESLPYNYFGQTTGYKLAGELFGEKTGPLQKDDAPGRSPGDITGYRAGYYASYEGHLSPTLAIFLYEHVDEALAAFERSEATSTNVRKEFDAPGIGDQSQGRVTFSAVLSTTSVIFQKGRVVAYVNSLDVPGSHPDFMIAMAKKLEKKIEAFLQTRQ